MSGFGRGRGGGRGSAHQGVPRRDRVAPNMRSGYISYPYRHSERGARPVPTSTAAWVIGMLNGGEEQWLLDYVETEVFSNTRKLIKDTTGLNVEWLVAACVALQKGERVIPQLIESLLDRFKEQATSSIRISAEDTTRYKGLLRLAAEKSSSESTSWLTIRGQHDCLDKDGTMYPARGRAYRFFWHEGTLFSLESPESRQQADKNREEHRNSSWDPYDHDQDDLRYNHGQTKEHLVVRCFGSDHKPVDDLIAHVERRAAMSEKLPVIRIMANTGDEEHQRDKRPIETIDLDPKMLNDIRLDAEDFFDEGTPKFCRDTGVPYRRGYLFHGPPGTGKSSLSVAIPSHVDVPMSTITLNGMDDKMLEDAFSRLPYRCVVLIEDIDCAGA